MQAAGFIDAGALVVGQEFGGAANKLPAVGGVHHDGSSTDGKEL